MPPFINSLGLKNSGSTDSDEIAKEGEEEEELSETKKLLKQVKEAGTAGIVSYALWELAFWAFSVPVRIHFHTHFYNLIMYIIAYHHLWIVGYLI